MSCDLAFNGSSLSFWNYCFASEPTLVDVASLDLILDTAPAFSPVRVIIGLSCDCLCSLY